MIRAPLAKKSFLNRQDAKDAKKNRFEPGKR
jgi:hypothetical protein